jgi:transcriptional regulator with XRE-family HTH domain
MESYVNPILKAREFESILKDQNLTQSQLAEKLGISRVRVTQILNLLKLPQGQQDYSIANGKEKQITERQLRNKNNVSM